MRDRRVNVRENIRIFKSIINFFNELTKELNVLLNPRKNKRIMDSAIEDVVMTGGANILDISYLPSSLWHTDKTKICKINPLYDVRVSLLNQFLKNEYISQETMYVSCVQHLNKQMDYESDSFDSCYLSLAYSDILNPNKTYGLPEIKRVLKRNGMLYLSQQSHVAYGALNELLANFDKRLYLEQTETYFKNQLVAVLELVNDQFEEVNHVYYKNDSFCCNIEEFIFYLLTNPNIIYMKQVVAERGICELKKYLLNFSENKGFITLPSRYDLIVCRK